MDRALAAGTVASVAATTSDIPIRVALIPQSNADVNRRAGIPQNPGSLRLLQNETRSSCYYFFFLAAAFLAAGFFAAFFLAAMLFTSFSL
ncbi:MAG TPA: hypothetical protein VLU92_11600 [Candidatus Dormibacteraeota bacterium]|nr:hypothetical protein [Candidatus Dormibacteraeota bacterium]